RHAVACEQVRAGAMFRGFGGDGLGAVLAELEGRGVVSVRPGAARAIEAVGLVGVQQRLRALDRDVLPEQLPGDAAECAPAAGRAVVAAARRLAHRGPPDPCATAAPSPTSTRRPC